MENSAFFEEHKNQLWFMTLRQFLRHKMAVFGMIIMAVIILMVVFVDQIVPYDPETPDLNNMLSPPSLQHPFGTDELGRDMFTRTMHGGRVSLIVGVFAMLVAVTIGTLVGAIAGYFGGTIDNFLMRFTDFALAFPRIFVLILFAIIFMRPPFSDNPFVVLVFGENIPTEANGGSGYNYTRHRDAELDKWLDLAGKAPSMEERAEAYRKAQARAAEIVPHIYLYRRVNVHAFRNNVKGWKPNGYGIIDAVATWNVADWYVE